MSKYEINELFSKNTPHLAALATADGEKEIYDAVSRCLRCGYCETVCPTYLMTAREQLSPRGRNQLIRRLVEGRLKGTEKAAEGLKTCLLCGACSEICYGKVPTADLVLEGRREMSGHGKNFYYRAAALLTRRKKIFSLAIKFLYMLKKAGLAALSDKLGLFYFLNMPGLAQAQKKALKTPLKFLTERLEKDKRLKEPKKLSWIYFSACGSEFIYTENGLATVELLLKIYGDGIIMKNECCGLVAYNYGSLDEAREAAVKNMNIYSELAKKFNEAAVIVDCSSCAVFLKSYPSLFSKDEKLRAEAENFSSRIKDIAEFIKPAEIDHLLDRKKLEGLRVTIHDSCRASHGQGIRKELREVLKPALKENLIEMPESDHCCGGAGAFAFTNIELSKKILQRKIENISSVRPDIVIASSTSCLMQIESGLKEMYPKARIKHYSLFLKESLKDS
ncbi:MAG: (Fe-S)-binding protein [Elusimicrobiota bacterium]